MDENGEILLLHASKNNMRPLIPPCALYTLGKLEGENFSLHAMLQNVKNLFHPGHIHLGICQA